MRYLGRGQRFKCHPGALLPARKRGLQHQPVVRADAHGLHQLRRVVHIQRVDDVSSEAAARDGGGVAFVIGALGTHLRQA